jgi:hypothetical protein
MLFYLLSFLLFLYFKIARVHRRDEKSSTIITVQHIVVFLSFMSTYTYGVLNIQWYFILTASLLFFIIAALIITTLQLGIFIDGKPLFGMSRVYKLLPLLTLVIISLSAIIWL